MEHGAEGTERLTFGTTEPFAGIPGLTEAQAAEATKRLQQHRLVTSDTLTTTNSYDDWYAVRPTADGLRVLGEWPPAEGAPVNVALARILRALADRDQVPEQDRTATRRAAGTLASIAGEVVKDVAQQEMRRLAGGV